MEELTRPRETETMSRRWPDASQSRSASHAHRSAKLALTVGLSLLSASFATGAHATDPATETEPNPFSWAQYKQDYAVSLLNDGFILWATGTPTMLYGSGQTSQPGIGPPSTLFLPNTAPYPPQSPFFSAGAQQPGFLLGDFRELSGPGGTAVPNEPPGPSSGVPSNTFRDTGSTSWTAPNSYVLAAESATSLESSANGYVTDDDSSPSPAFTTTPVVSSVPANPAWTSSHPVGTDGTYTTYQYTQSTVEPDAAANATWAFNSSNTPTLYNGQFDVYVFIPPIPTPSTETRVTNALYTITRGTATPLTFTVDQSAAANQGTYVELGGPYIVSAAAGITVTLSNANQFGTGGTYTLVADAVQLRPDGAIVDDDVQDSTVAPDPDPFANIIFNSSSDWTLGAVSGTTDQYGSAYLVNSLTSSTTNTNVNDNDSGFVSTNDTNYTWQISTDTGGATDAGGIGTTYHYLDITTAATASNGYATWTLTAPTVTPSSNTVDVYTYIPAIPSGGGPWLTDAHYTVMDSANHILATITINQEALAGQFVALASGITIPTDREIVVKLSDATTSPGNLVADMTQLRQASTVTYRPNVPSAGLYSLYAWFPSEGTNGTTDAHYTASVNGASVVDQRINQQNGGTWEYVGGPFQVAPTDNVVVQIDNTSLNTINTGEVVAADAIELRAGGESATVYGSPASVNITDYPELTPSSPLVTGTAIVGGKPLNYIAPLALNGALDAVNNVYTFSAGATNDSTAKTFPINQVVYFTRTESVTTTNGVEVVGAVYCVDGLNGNVIWRYPSKTQSTNDPLELPSTIASSPIVIRKMMVRVTNPALTTQGDIYEPRDVVIVGDSNGKLFCLDAAGEGDGNDTVVDSVGTAVSFDDTGAQTSGNGTDLHVVNVGRTDCYWVWQPNSAVPLSRSYYSETIDDDAAKYDTLASQFVSTAPWTMQTASGNGAYGDSYYRASPVNTPTVPLGTVTWNADPPATLTAPTQCYVYVSHPSQNVGVEDHVKDADYKVYDSTGAAFVGISKTNIGTTIKKGVDQTLPGGFEQLYDVATGQPMVVTISGPGTGTTNCVTLDNATTATITPTTYIVADAVTFQAINALKESDGTTDLPVPSDYRLNSVTAALFPDPNFLTNGAYDATLFVGNSNGVVYSLDASGTYSNPYLSGATTNPGPYSAVDPNIYDLSLDPQFPTVRVNWWFSTGGGIAYSPAYDPSNNYVYVTSYDPTDNNHGRLFAINNWFGPVGNGGLSYDYDTSVLSAPGTYNYNINQIPEWSFPDGYGTVHAFSKTGSPFLGIQKAGGMVKSSLAINSTNEHWLQGDGTTNQTPYTTAGNQPLHIVTSEVLDPTGVTQDQVSCLSLGDIAAPPTVFTNNGLTNIYIEANDPVTSLNGRVMAVSETGNFVWSYPSTYISGSGPEDPNSVNDVNSQQGTTGVFTVATNSTTGLATVPTIGGFTEELQAPTWFVSSSAAMGKITFPTIPANTPTTTATALSVTGSTAANITTPMLYTGDTDGNLYALQAQQDTSGGALLTDAQRLIYNEPILDGSPIYSAPALLGGSSTSANLVPNIGGVVFLTTSTDDLTEIEATPYLYNNGTTTGTVVNTDVDFTGPGSLSSPALAGFLADNIEANNVSTTSSLARIYTDIFEWLYCGSDNGPLYGVSPRAAIGGGGGTGFDTGTYTPPDIDNTPPLQTVDLSRNLLTAVSAVSETGPFTWTDPNDYSPSIINGNQAKNPFFEWGQTVYIKVYGLDNPIGSGVTTSSVPDPRFLSCTFTLSTIGTGGRVTRVETQTITPDVLKTVTFSGATTAAAASAATGGVLSGDYVGVFAYKIGNGDDRAQTPGSKIRITNVTETVLLDGRVQIVKARIDTGTVVRNSSGNLKETTPTDQATFGILNPLAVRGGGITLGASPTVLNVALHPVNVTSVTNQSVGPFITFTSPAPAFSAYQLAAGNGNNIPETEPQSGSISTGGGIADPTQALSLQVHDPVYFTMVVATATRLSSDGSSTDNGLTGQPSNEDPGYAYGSQESPGVQSPSGYSDYGSDALNVADRSALGVASWFIDRTRMTNPKQGWNDDSGRNGPGSVVNPLPWDSLPNAYYMGLGNSSPDYPDIPNNHITVVMAQRSGPNGEGGGSGDLTQGPQQLAPSQGGNSVYPQALDVQVNIPKFQPANLEEYAPTTLEQITNGITRANAVTTPATVLPHGYVGATRVFVDSNNDGRWSPGEAFRDVQVWTDVQADMSTVIQEPTVDAGRIAAGVGIENPISGTAENGTSSEWSPYLTGSNTNSLYEPYYQPVTVHALTNVNLVNVHFDQVLKYENSSTLASLGKPWYLPLQSDETADTSFIPSIDSLAGLGVNDGVLTSAPGATDGATAMPIVRSNIDFFSPSATYSSTTGGWSGGTAANPAFLNTYQANLALLDSSGNYLYPGPTLHKPRVGDDPTVGSYLKTPDEPHDSNHPMNNGTPTGTMLSVAVPLGTPVGTYSQTVRVFEGTDPITASTAFKGPTYGGGYIAPISSSVTPYASPNTSLEYALPLLVTASSGDVTPGNYYSDPGTVVKAEVIEAPLTGVSPSHVPTNGLNPASGSLPNIDGDQPQDLPAQPSTSNQPPSNTPTPSTTNIQPWAFPLSTIPTTGQSGIGLLWTSGRFDWDGNTTSKYNYPYDIFASIVDTTEQNGFVNSGVTYPGWGTIIDQTQTQGSSPYWWTSPTPVEYPINNTAPATTTAAQEYDPFVLEPVISDLASTVPATVASTSSGLNYVLYVSSDTTTNASGGTPTTTYSLLVRLISGSNLSTLGNGSSVLTLTTSSQPIFHPRAVWWSPSSGAAPYMIITWTTQIHGRSTLMYKVYNPTTPSPIGPDQALPLPGGFSDVSDATPVPRFLLNAVGGTPSCYIDLTYSARSESADSTDIFTSRYAVNSPASIVNWTLSLQSMAAHNSTMTETLSPSTSHSVWRAQDVAWVRDPNYFSLSTLNPLTQAVTPIIAAGSTNYTTDVASGEWIYHNVNISNWDSTSGATSTTVAINPYDGTIRISPPPVVSAVNGQSVFTSTLVASVAPQAVRITGTNDVTTATGQPGGSGVNTQATVFIDRAPKVGGTPVGTTSATAPVVQTARYWYIYRKSALGASVSAAINSTLYMNTRRLTVVLPNALSIQTNGTLTGLTVTASPTVGGTASTLTSSQYDVDWKRGRIYFPEGFEGWSATITYTDYVANGAAGTNGSNNTVTVGPTPVVWMDEPYGNMPPDASQLNTIPSAIGERTVPISTSLNEAEPNAFLDPAAFVMSGSGGGASTDISADPVDTSTYSGNPVNPHRVWLFWTSRRNAYNLHRNYVATSISTAAAVAATSITVGLGTNIQIGDVLHLDYGANEEDVAVASGYTGGTTVPINSPLKFVHPAGRPVSNIRSTDYVSVPDDMTSATHQYYIPRTVNPSGPASGTSSDWTLYNGNTDIYWEALDPRFEIAP